VEPNQGAHSKVISLLATTRPGTLSNSRLMILNMRQRVGMIAASLFLFVGGTLLGQRPLASEKQSPVQEGQHLLDGNCVLIKSTHMLPDSLKAAFAELARESEFKLADPDEDFQVGDVVVHPGLPFRRLVLAGRCGDNWFIHYERGGIAHGFYLVVFQSESQRKPKFIWGGAGVPKATQIADIRKALADGKFISDPRTYW